MSCTTNIEHNTVRLFRTVRMSHVLTLRMKAYKDTSTMSRNKEGAARPPRHGDFDQHTMDRVVLLYAACLAKRVAMLARHAGSSAAIDMASTLSDDEKVLFWIEMAVLTNKSFVFKTKWLNSNLAHLGQAYRSRWDRLSGRRNEKKTRITNSNAAVQLRSRMDTGNLSLVLLPAKSGGPHALSAYDDMTFEVMWEMLHKKA